jgi:hypothetical protein
MESAIVGATAFTPKVTKNTKQVTKSGTSFVTALCPWCPSW